MRIFCVVVAISMGGSLIRAQEATSDVALLAQTRAAYDAPFERGLKSFDCAIDFNWKQHWKDTYRVGDEGTDEEIETRIQPLHNRVVVTLKDAVVSSGMTDEEEQKLPRGGMAEGLLKHAVRFSLRTWLVAANNALLPSADTPVHFESSASGYHVGYKIQNFDVVMQFTHDLRLQSMSAKGSEGDRQEFDFQSGPQGFVLGSWTMGENGNFAAGNHLIFTYSYQRVDGFQLPAQMVVNRESHHEVWRYTLSDCKVTKE
jgi:hypothetical protein